jgi:hypothetical protein
MEEVRANAVAVRIKAGRRLKYYIFEEQQSEVI